MARLTLWAAGAVGFGVLAVLNTGGYRFGVSDQAFYIPVVLQEMAPDLYPYDAALIAAQDRFFLFDDWFAPLLTVTGLSIETGFLVAFGFTLVLLYGAALGIGRALYSSGWTVAGLVLALTLRHRIPDTAVNTLESYFHPRLLAFAVGLAAVGVLLRGRTLTALAVTGLALAMHPTTGLWFAIWVGTAALISEGPHQRALRIGAAVTTLTIAGLVVGPIREQLVVMDPAWVNVLVIKDYLIATDWPAVTWVGNLSMAVLIAAIYRYRRSLGLVSTFERGLVVGCGVLLALFLVSLPFAAAKVAFAVQMQFNRIFWILDVFGTCYLIWLLVESPLWSSARAHWLRHCPRPAFVVLVLVATLTRGGYVMLVERAGHPMVQPRLLASDWSDVMDWASEEPVGTHFLAHPGHVHLYGSSVRAASGRDVYLEVVKDTGIAIYSAEVADRIAKRTAGLGNFDTLDADRALALARQYDLDFLITENELDLPETRRTGRFHVYDLTGRDPILAEAAAAPPSTLRDN